MLTVYTYSRLFYTPSNFPTKYFFPRKSSRYFCVRFLLQVVQQFPQEFNELIYYILMDESFHLTYPHIRQRILPIAEKFDKDNFQVYLKSDEVCQSFAAACDLLNLDETSNEVNETTSKLSILLFFLFAIKSQYFAKIYQRIFAPSFFSTFDNDHTIITFV